MKRITILPDLFISKIPPNTFSNLFVKKYPKFILDHNENFNWNPFQDIYFQQILNNKNYKYLISSYIMHLDSNVEYYDIKINFQYKNYHLNENLILDYTNSKKCNNCFVWDYKINLFLPNDFDKDKNKNKYLQNPIIKYEKNNCGLKFLLDNKTPDEIKLLYQEILNLETK